jgi:hypothetical protein
LTADDRLYVRPSAAQVRTSGLPSLVTARDAPQPRERDSPEM